MASIAVQALWAAVFTLGTEWLAPAALAGLDTVDFTAVDSMVAEVDFTAVVEEATAGELGLTLSWWR